MQSPPGLGGEETKLEGEERELDGEEINPTPLEIPLEFYDFKLTPEYLNLTQDLARVETLGNPFFRLYEGIATDTITKDGKKLINYSGYNYLGMSGNKKVSAAAKTAIDIYGTSVSASRVLAGERDLHQALEQEIADLIGVESSITYVSGHSTNVSTIGHLFGAKDLIVYDTLSHNSIQQGCLLSGATLLEFPHNDWRSLSNILSQNRPHYQKVLIAIEGIYSSDGDIPPLAQIIALKKRYKTFLMVDEAHSIGVLGKTGRGISEYCQINPQDVDLWMGTLSKSFASCGGYIAGSKELIEYLKYTSPGFVFSVGMSPANTAAALEAIRLLKTNHKKVNRLHKRALLFLQLAQNLGLNTGNSNNTPIIPIIVGGPSKAVNLSQQLYKHGINAQPMVFPSVPYNAARVRFFINSTHTKTQIHYTIETLGEILNGELGS